MAAPVVDRRSWSHNRKVAFVMAQRGIAVFPCHEIGQGEHKAKSPRNAGGHLAATRDEAKIAEWWERWPDALVGLNLAGAGLFAVDLDRHGGPDGVAAWGELAALFDFDPAKHPRILTPGHGEHIYFRRPAEMAASNCRGALPSGIDVRGSGYTIAPYCRLPDGREYAMAAGSINLMVDVPEAPAWLVKVIGASETPRPAHERQPAVPLDGDVELAAAKAVLDADTGAVEGVGGDQHTYAVACRLRALGVSEGVALDMMAGDWNARCVPPWGPEELERKIANAYLYGQGAAGAASPRLAFAGVEVPHDEPRQAVRRAGLQWADDADADEPMAWLIKNILPRNGVAILYGAPKSGKSFAAFDLAARLASKLPWFDARTPREAVGAVLLLGEGSGTARTRLRAFRQATGQGALPLAWCAVRDLASREGLNAARVELREAAAGMNDRGVRLGVIVVDTIASAMGVQDENSAPEVTAAMQGLEALAVEFDAAVLALHHAGKNGLDRGSSAFRAACDAMLAVERVDGLSGQPSTRRTLTLLLNRNGEEGWTANFELARVVLGIDADGDEIGSSVVRAAGEPPALASRRDMVMAQFDPGLLSMTGLRVGGDSWGITRKELHQRCAAIWDDLKPDAARKALNRAVKELLASGNLNEVADGDGVFLVASAAAVTPPIVDQGAL